MSKQLEKILKKTSNCEHIGEGRTFCKYILQNGINYVSCKYLTGAKCGYEIPKVTIGYKNERLGKNSIEYNG